jgi:hypothetical protein
MGGFEDPATRRVRRVRRAGVRRAGADLHRAGARSRLPRALAWYQLAD